MLAYRSLFIAGLGSPVFFSCCETKWLLRLATSDVALRPDASFVMGESGAARGGVSFQLVCSFCCQVAVSAVRLQIGVPSSVGEERIGRG